MAWTTEEGWHSCGDRWISAPAEGQGGVRPLFLEPLLWAGEAPITGGCGWGSHRANISHRHLLSRLLAERFMLSVRERP